MGMVREVGRAIAVSHEAKIAARNVPFPMLRRSFATRIDVVAAQDFKTAIRSRTAIHKAVQEFKFFTLCSRGHERQDTAETRTSCDRRMNRSRRREKQHKSGAE